MRGVILAGGTGSRLYPKTKYTNKHLLLVGHVPMINHGIYKLKEAGISEILVVTSKRDIYAMIKHLGYGERFGVKLSFAIQEEAGGVAEALGLANEFSRKEPITVILGDNIFSYSLKEHVSSFIETGSEAMVFLKEVKDPKRYGVATMNNNMITSIEEKPIQPKSNYAVTGIYIYSPAVFSIIKTLRPSERKELEITDVNNVYISRGSLESKVLQGYWIDAGTHESLAEANRLVLNEASYQTRNQVLVK